MTPLCRVLARWTTLGSPEGERTALDDVCLASFRDRSSPELGVYTCRHSQKGTRSPRANDRALPVGVSDGLQGRVGRANGALSPACDHAGISCMYVVCSMHVGVVPTFLWSTWSSHVVLTSDQFPRWIPHRDQLRGIFEKELRGMLKFSWINPLDSTVPSRGTDTVILKSSQWFCDNSLLIIVTNVFGVVWCDVW